VLRNGSVIEPAPIERDGAHSLVVGALRVAQITL
jgi:hypothetical protein